MTDVEQYEIVIGLEVHAQLTTRSKLFCGDSTQSGAQPNTQVSIISLAHPGTLPMLNNESITKAIKLGIACHCEIVRNNYFARKNYFYPDLPKGYQISQHTTPICRSGFLELNVAGNSRKIRINRIHIEEDAGKSLHDESGGYSNIDFNRAGMPLLEIVTEPDLRSAEEAFSYVTALRRMVRYLDVCDGNMEEGSLRCDVNISVRKKEDPALGTRVEIKNLNSIRYIKKAIEHESQRLISLHRKGEPILQQTRGFDETTFTTYPIRTKEDEDDYRYFPEPDLPPFFISEEFITGIRSQMPPLQEDIKNNLIRDFALSGYDAEQIANDSEWLPVFLDIASITKNYKAAANWLIGPIKQYLSANDLSPEEFPVTGVIIGEIINLIDGGKISYGIATQKILPELIKNPSLNVSRFINDQNLNLETSQNEIDRLIDAALTKHSEKITEYKKGKKGLISLFVGEVMKLSKGKADAKMVTEKIIEKLKV